VRRKKFEYIDYMAEKKDLSSMSTDALKSQLGTLKKLHTAIMVVFVIIIMLWVILGYWQKNLTFFISTIMLSVVISGSLIASRSGINNELKKRNNEVL
jgi:ABC-type multidrug transport system permease subunit